MSITSVSSTLIPAQTAPLPQTQPSATTGLAGVTKEIKPPHHHHGGGHGPSTEPVDPTTTASSDGGVNTLA
jgi:hypothetical protein